MNNVETDRHSLSANVPERILMEYWLPHWKAGIVEGHAQSVMASYNELNHVPNIANNYLLTDILRGLWNFDGFVVSDLGGVNTSLVQGSKITDKIEVAVARAIEAGCDLDDDFYENNLPGDVRSRPGLRGHRQPAPSPAFCASRSVWAHSILPARCPTLNCGADVIDSAAHRELALKTAQESIVLLRNQNDFLPLDKIKLKSVAVIGPQADKFETGNYYGAKPRIVSPVEGLRAKLGSAVKVEYTLAPISSSPRNLVRSSRPSPSRGVPTSRFCSSEPICGWKLRVATARASTCPARRNNCWKRSTRPIQERLRSS